MPGARLTLEEREILSRGLVAESSCQQIARELERPASTVRREVGRGVFWDGNHLAVGAQE